MVNKLKHITFILQINTLEQEVSQKYSNATVKKSSQTQTYISKTLTKPATKNNSLKNLFI